MMMRDLLPQVAAHLGSGWRAVLADVSEGAAPNWANEHLASLVGPRGWQLHISCQHERMTISGLYAGKSLGSYIRVDGCNEIGVSMDRHPRAIANDITRRLLEKDYPALFERAKSSAQIYAAREESEIAMMARLMSLDPDAKYLYYSNKEARIFNQGVKPRGVNRVEFERLEVSEAAAILILRIVAASPQK